MDVVYRHKRASTPELVYSLRSLRNLPHDRVWVFGDPPATFTLSEQVHYVRIRQDAGSKWNNSRKNIRAACENPDVSDDFILMDDDFYIMRAIRSIPMLHRGDLIELAEKYKRINIDISYTRGMIETAEMLRYFGLSKSFDLLAYNIHTPMVINKAKMLECLDATERLAPKHIRPMCLHLRSFYGNYWQVGGRKSEDIKLTQPREIIPPHATFISTANEALRLAGRGSVRAQLAAAFPSQSPYESATDRQG